jgi:GT2 family glycosyltransferase
VIAGGPFQRQLRDSLVRLLAGSSRGGADAGIVRALKPVRAALEEDALPLALRHLDRAWRAFPHDAITIAPLYARALMLDAVGVTGNYDAALSIAELALDLAPDPDIAATRLWALLAQGRTALARERLEAALTEYCVDPGGTLACAADELSRHPSIAAPGWVGLGPTLDLVHGLVRPDTAAGLLLKIDAGRRIAHCHGVPLLGSGARTPADFLLDGRTVNRGRRLTAWARLGCLPERAPRLRFADAEGGAVEIDTGGTPYSGWRWPCTLDLHASKLRGNRIEIAARLPDGRWQPLPDSPLLLDPGIPRAPARDARAAPRTRRPQRRRRIDVIIPVYGNREESLACIESALATLPDRARLVVVDDAGEDSRLGAALDALAAAGRLTLLRNAQNLGFAGAVNRGLAYDPSRDVVLLNSDTRVCGGWLERLQAAAYSDAAVGTVTPLSNNGSITSYPHASGNPAVAHEVAASLDELAASANAGRYLDIPVGVGFCLYVRRDCLNAVGNLDAAVFGSGYGEETDFCLRAKRQGWSHRLAADVYVSHAGALSFGTRRAALLDRSQRLLNLRHAGYDRSIERFLARDPLHPVRRNLDERRLRAHPGPHVLLVTLALRGGVDRFVKERCRQLRAAGLTPLVLRPVKPDDAGSCELATDVLEVPNLRYSIPAELPALTTVLQSLEFVAIEIQHFLHLDARVIEAVRALPVPYDVFVHDYAWLCPRVTLLDGRDRYCGEPAVTVCETCVKRNGSSLGERLSVAALRRRSARWLAGARRVTAPSGDTAARLRRYFGGLEVEVQPHTPCAPPPAPESRQPHESRESRTAASLGVTPVRVALIGAIGAHKGFRILLECARDARARRLPLEFVVIGYTENDAPLLATGKVFITGPYLEGEAPHLLARERPDIAWLPSVWPETWCYTLDHALDAGLPVVAFDLGAIAERLRKLRESSPPTSTCTTPHAPQTLLLPLDTPSQRINDALLDFLKAAPVAARAPPNSVKSLPAPEPRMASIDELQPRGMRMTNSSNGKASNGKAPNGKAPAEPADAGLSASVQVLPLAAGLYLFSVKAAKPITVVGEGELTLPAMHVGLGPGVRSEQVEFISSPSTHGAWLFSATDLLVTRINGAGATLILTSVRAPAGEVLSIKVERLDSRIDAAESAGQPLAAAPVAALATPARDSNAPLPVQMVTHVRTRGDMQFVDAPWAGRVGPGLWIESFAVLPLEHLGAHDIEYKGLTGSGFETPWLSDNAACGTKGLGIPLVGFAMRLRPTPAAAGYDCEYSGYFQSGLTVGPLRNGAPCRSSVANDPLEGIQVRLVKRPGVALAAKPTAHATAHATTARAATAAKPKAKMPALAAVKPGKRVALAR